MLKQHETKTNLLVSYSKYTKTEEKLITPQILLNILILWVSYRLPLNYNRIKLLPYELNDTAED